MTESKLIYGCKALDPSCQRELVRVYSGMLYTVARRYCGDGALAQDALQEGLIRILTKIDSWKDMKGSFEGWMRRIVANESLRILEKETRQTIVDIDDLEIEAVHPGGLDRLSEEELIYYIQCLPIGYREVFNMYIIDGFDHNEIGHALHIKPSSSRSRLTRAKELLRNKIFMVENLHNVKSTVK